MDSPILVMLILVLTVDTVRIMTRGFFCKCVTQCVQIPLPKRDERQKFTVELKRVLANQLASVSCVYTFSGDVEVSCYHVFL